MRFVISLKLSLQIKKKRSQVIESWSNWIHIASNLCNLVLDSGHLVSEPELKASNLYVAWNEWAFYWFWKLQEI